MKELETHLKIDNQERIELNVKKQQEIEYVLEGEIKPQSGHFVWELNEETGAIKKAAYKQDTIAILGASIEPTKLVINADCVYIPALNADNAKKKYLKNKEQSFYYTKQPLLKLWDK